MLQYDNMPFGGVIILLEEDLTYSGYHLTWLDMCYDLALLPSIICPNR